MQVVIFCRGVDLTLQKVCGFIGQVSQIIVPTLGLPTVLITQFTRRLISPERNIFGLLVFSPFYKNRPTQHIQTNVLFILCLKAT